jgi:hypothetical protein
MSIDYFLEHLCVSAKGHTDKPVRKTLEGTAWRVHLVSAQIENGGACVYARIRYPDDIVRVHQFFAPFTTKEVSTRIVETFNNCFDRIVAVTLPQEPSFSDSQPFGWTFLDLSEA